MNKLNKQLKKILSNKEGVILLEMMRETYVDIAAHNLDSASLAYQAGQRDLVLDLIEVVKPNLDISYHDSESINVILNDMGEL